MTDDGEVLVAPVSMSSAIVDDGGVSIVLGPGAVAVVEVLC